MVEKSENRWVDVRGEGVFELNWRAEIGSEGAEGACVILPPARPLSQSDTVRRCITISTTTDGS